MNETVIREISDYATATCVADRLSVMFNCKVIKHRILMRRITNNREQIFQFYTDGKPRSPGCKPFSIGVKLDDSVKQALGLIIEGLVILVNAPEC